MYTNLNLTFINKSATEDDYLRTKKKQIYKVSEIKRISVTSDYIKEYSTLPPKFVVLLSLNVT